jgi:hypothetical protein
VGLVDESSDFRAKYIKQQPMMILWAFALGNKEGEIPMKKAI